MKRSRSFLRYRNGNRDAAHKPIIDGLRKLGYFCIDLAGAGDGVADLLVFGAFGKPTFIEVKSPKAKLRDSQREFARRLATYDVRHGVARSLDEALVLVGHHIRARITERARDVDRKAAAVVAAYGGAHD